MGGSVDDLSAAAERARRDAEQQAAILAVAEDLASSLEPRVVISRLLERLIDALRAERGTVSWVDGEHFITEYSHDPVGVPTRRGSRLRFTQLPECVEAIRARRPVLAGPVDMGVVEVEDRAPYDGVRHRLLIPVLVAGEVVSLVALSRRRDEPFTSDDVERVSPFMGVAGVALRNALLYDSSERARERAMRAITSIARHTAGTPDLPEFFGHLTRTMAELVEAEAVVFWRLRNDLLTVVPHAHGMPAESEGRVGSIPCRPDGTGPAERVVRDDVVHRTSASQDVDDPFRHLVDVLGTDDALVVAWRAGERTVGAISAHGSLRSSGFSDEDVWVLRIAANAAGLVWENAEALRQLSGERDREEDRLRASARRAADLERAKSRFLNLVSHELRGPISVARGYISMLSDGSIARDADVDKVLGIVGAKLQQINMLVDDMLEAARLDEDRLSLDRRRVDLREIAAGAVEAVRGISAQPSAITLELPSDPIPVDVDPRRITAIVSNLLDNAVKYSLRPGPIVCGVAASGSVATVQVEDRGVGIPEEDADILFTRFGRIVTSENSHVPGSGLGLHLSRELARMHGGELEVVSRRGVGTTAILTLPLAGRAQRSSSSATA